MTYRSAILTLALSLLAALGHAQTSSDWPSRAVRVIVPYPADGSVDVLARALVQKLQERWQQPVTVDNRPGANTLIGTEMVARSNDGHGRAHRPGCDKHPARASLQGA